MAFSALASSGAFLLSLYVLQRAALSFGSAWIMGFLAISIGLIIAPNKVPPKLQIRYPRWDLPARIFSATAMVLIITLSASVLGAEWSGLAILPSFLVYVAAIFASLIVSLPWLKGKLVLPAE